MTLPLAIRPYDEATDMKFMFKAWVSSYERSPWAGTIPAHLTAAIHHATIHQLLQRGMRITMAVNPDDRDQILGFLAWEPGLVHYCFVKDLFRRQGVASQLMASANFDRTQPLLTSFRTPDARHLGKLVHRPGLARRKAAYP